MTITDLEQNFNDVYGLSVQVFRKSGNGCLETSVIDNWTLEKQNKQGEELSKSREKEMTKIMFGNDEHHFGR